MLELGPVFRHHASLSIFSKVLKDALSPAQLRGQLSLPDSMEEANRKEGEEQKTYRKLWDVKPITLHMKEVWQVPNAGLVLLWPYLNVLFERAGFMENSEFLDDAAHQKAVFLTEYLVSANTTPDEHQLVFNKVLCGYPVAAPLELDFEVDEDMESLCEGLLSAVIGHWPVLGDTSIESFRETFLIREGHLGLTSEFWQLQVARKAYDLLLRELPWGISTVNLSWMDQIIKVEWET